MVACARQRPVARVAVFSRRRLLLRFDPKPSPDGDGSRPRGKPRTLAIAYRRAPEHPYPAAHQDALTAWRALRTQGIAAENIAVGGDSAGGNSRARTNSRLRAAGEPQPGCAWLASPWTDLTMSGKTLDTKDTVDPLIHRGYLAELADAYAPAPSDRRDPLISPLFADLAGFPPVLIQVGSAETLIADATRLAPAAAQPMSGSASKYGRR